MKTFIVEFTCLIFRDELEIAARSEAEARRKFNKENPGIEGGNGRIVSVRLKGKRKNGSFQSRLASAREG